jgi:hypothetical protein
MPEDKKTFEPLEGSQNYQVWAENMRLLLLRKNA